MSAAQKKIEEPNWTYVPNVLLDNISKLSEVELRVMLVVTRKTSGWHKRQDRMSLSQLVEATGLSKQGVLDGITAGTERGWLTKTPVDKDAPSKGFKYGLLVHSVDKQKGKVVNLVDSTSQHSRQDTVKPVDTQKKGKETKQKKGKDSAASAAPPPSQSSDLVPSLPSPQPPSDPTPTTTTAKRRKAPTPDSAAPPSHANHPLIAAYRLTFQRYPGKAQMAQLAQMEATPLEEGRFVAACQAWLMAGYNPNNLRGILDWYRGGVPDYRPANPNAHTKPVPKPKPSPSPYADMTEEEKAAYLASCEPIEDDEYDHD